MSIEQLAVESAQLLDDMRKLANSDANIEWSDELEKKTKNLVSINATLKDWKAAAQKVLNG